MPNTNEPSRSVSYLNSTFRKAIEALSHAESLRLPPKTEDVYDRIKEYEIEFAYIIDDIERGAEHFVVKRISDANKLIHEIEDLAGIKRSDE